MKLLVAVAVAAFAGAVHAQQTCNTPESCAKLLEKVGPQPVERRQPVAPKPEPKLSRSEEWARRRAEADAKALDAAVEANRAKEQARRQAEAAAKEATKQEVKRDMAAEEACLRGDREGCRHMTALWEDRWKLYSHNCARDCADARDAYREYLKWEGLRVQAKK